jgi:hypothetical protein
MIMMTDSSKIIDRLGGNSEVSRLFSISSQAVSKWRREGIPEPRLMYLRLARPEVFVEESSSDTPQKAA